MLPWTYLEDPGLADELALRLKKTRGADYGEILRQAQDAYTRWKNAVRDGNVLRERKNSVSAEFAKAKKAGENEVAEQLLAESKRISIDMAGVEQLAENWQEVAHNLYAQIPNLPADDVPEGDEANNLEVSATTFTIDVEVPAKPTFDFPIKDHVELGTRMGCMDFEQTTKISGTRFVTLSGALAKLERELAGWMVDFATTVGFKEISPPSLVNERAMFGTGQLPKFEDDLFKTTDGRYLIPTAEVSVTNVALNRVVEFAKLDQSVQLCAQSYVAFTNCYRAEAGAAGRDSRGMMRQHEFKKVELVTLCNADSSGIFHQAMVSASQSLLKQLGLNWRVVLLAAGDMGFSAQKTYDLEVWIPGQDCYREIASISNCGEFQARRMNARWKFKGEKGTQFLTTLNGSALAVGRTLLAVMENYQTEQGGIRIPQVLRARMGGSLITHEGEII